MFSKKGLSVIVSTLLLIVIVVVASVIIYTWLAKYTHKVTKNAEDVLFIKYSHFTDNKLYIHVSTLSKLVLTEVKVFDVGGNLVCTKSVNTEVYGHDVVVVDLSHCSLRSGAYIAKLIGKNGKVVAVVKFVKK